MTCSVESVRLWVPDDREVFELLLDGDTVDPMEMARAYNLDTTGWKFEGPAVESTQTCRFKLVWVGYCRDLDEVRRKVEANAGETLAEGQWREAFKVAYLPCNGDFGFGGSRWTDSLGRSHFACLRGPFPFWRASLQLSDGSLGSDLGSDWRWLVHCD